MRSNRHRTDRSVGRHGLGAARHRTGPLAHELRDHPAVALGLHNRNQRRAPRVDVLLRLQGELVPVAFDIRILNVSRTGFALISAARFRAGDRLDFRLTGKHGPPVHVTAAAVHTQPIATSPGLFVTGFQFESGRVSGAVPDAAIEQLIAAVAPAGFKF